MLTEAIILSGGFGTRLSHVLGDVPKPMAPVAGKPFLSYVLDRLHDAGIRRVVLATGYRHDVIASYFGSQYRGIDVVCSEEKTPLFTGGAVLQAAKLIQSDDFLVLNGDTLFDIDFQLLSDAHVFSKAYVTIALRHVPDAGRYGAVETSGNTIVSFREKDSSAGEGLINGGIYVVSKSWFLGLEMPLKFSFEKEVLQARVGEGCFHGVVFDNYFIDIGVPDDYLRAQHDFMSDLSSDRFLFLDRDGVLNRQIVGDYVRSWEQWEWIDGACESVARLSKQYDKVFVVSNQQGVGKGLFTKSDLDDIHKRMIADIQSAGGRIDYVYVCTSLETAGDPCRKPDIGMALLAQQDFPEVDFSRSVMVGDSLTDMLFGYRAGMRCIYLTNSNSIPAQVRNYTDIILPKLSDF